MTIEDLHAYGMDRMDDDEMDAFLASQSVGVLGLPAERAPSMRPMSYWYDGDATLYFLYVIGSTSRKEQLSSRTDVARLLVYSAETAFTWRSVLVTGPISEVPEAERGAIRDAAELRWRPDLFERASAAEDTVLYRLRIDEWVGIKHSGLPSGFEDDASDSRSE